LPASPEAFVWLRLWVAQLGELDAGECVWQTLRRRSSAETGDAGRVGLTYDALRAVFRRANAELGTRWTMHDLRHTCAIRMLRAQGVSLRDVQVILGHAHLATTQIYLQVDDSEVITRVHEYLATRRDQPPPPPVAADGYDPADLAVLLGPGWSAASEVPR